MKWKFSRCTSWNASRWRVGGKPGLGAGDVEAHDAVITPPHCELGDLARPCRGAHGRDQAVDRDRVARRGRRCDPSAKPSMHGSHHVVEAECCLSVQLRRESAPRHTRRRQLRDPPRTRTQLGTVRRGLHHGQGVVEPVEVEHEISTVGTGDEPLRELFDIGRGQALVAARLRELEHRRRTHATVEVIVQQRFGCSPQRLEIGPAHGSRVPATCRNPRSGMSSPRCNQLSAGYDSRPLDQMHRVRVARLRRAVRPAVVRELPVQHDQGARGRLERHEPPVAGLGKGRVVERVESRAALRRGRRNRFRSGPRCPPGSAHRHPFSSVASSNANQNPTHVKGSV